MSKINAKGVERIFIDYIRYVNEFLIFLSRPNFVNK